MAIVMKTKIQRKQKKKKMSNSERILFEKWSLFFPVLICKTFVCIKHPAPCCKQKAWEASSCFQQWEKGAKHFESWLVETEKKKKRWVGVRVGGATEIRKNFCLEWKESNVFVKKEEIWLTQNVAEIPKGQPCGGTNCAFPSSSKGRCSNPGKNLQLIF